MDTRSSSLVVGLYLLGAVVLAAIVGLAFLGRGGGPRDPPAGGESGPSSSANGQYLRRGAMTREEFLAVQSAAEVERLRRLLEEKTETLQQRNALLQKRTAEYQKLKQDFDAAADLVLQFFESAAPAPEIKADHSEAEDSTSLTADLPPVEVAALREDLNRARLLETALAAEVEELRAEVLAAEAEIARIDQEARAQMDLLLASERELRQAADQALAQVGEPAIAVLTEALEDERPAIRRWAANVLGEMGAAATPAVGPLMEALNDRDESVRFAAGQALRALGRRD